MSEFLKIHSNCGVISGPPRNTTGVILLMNNVSHDYNICENVLEAIHQKVPTHAVCAITPNKDKNAYKLYIHGIEYACELLRGVTVNDQDVKVLPLFSHFTISNVHPSIQNSFLLQLFSKFGTIIKAEYVFACPNSASFGHVVTEKRRIIFENPISHNFVLPQTLSIVHNNFLLNVSVEKFCSACMTTGHEIMKCPDTMSVNSELNDISINDTIPLNISAQSNKVINDLSVSDNLKDNRSQFICVPETERINVKKLIKIVKILKNEQKLRKLKKKMKNNKLNITNKK